MRIAPLLNGVIRDTWVALDEAHLWTVAGSMAFSTIFAGVPLIAVSLSVFQLLGSLASLRQSLEPFLLQNLAPGTSAEAITALRDFVDHVQPGALGLAGILGLMITCTTMLLSAESAINHVWKAPVSRHVLTRLSNYWMLITLGPLALAAIIALATASHLPIGQLLPVGIFYLTFKFVPHRPVHWKAALIAGIICGLGWNLARLLYSLYNSKVMTYSKIYGALGTIPILLLWIYIMWLITLAGAALSAALQKRVDFK